LCSLDDAGVIKSCALGNSRGRKSSLFEPNCGDPDSRGEAVQLLRPLRGPRGSDDL